MKKIYGLMLILGFSLSGCVGIDPVIQAKMTENGITEKVAAEQMERNKKYFDLYGVSFIEFLLKRNLVPEEDIRKVNYMPATQPIEARHLEYYALHPILTSFYGDISSEDIKEIEKLKSASILAGKKAAEKAAEKVEADKQSNIKMKVKMAKNGITEEDICGPANMLIFNAKRGYVCKPSYVIPEKEVDALIIKNNEKKVKADADKKAAAEKEATLKIQFQKQYICTDGYDSWILKYNGTRITFGERNFVVGLAGYEDQFGKLRIIIDRAKGTVWSDGNNLTCKPR